MPSSKRNQPNPTTAGNILGAISGLIMMASAVPIVTWRNAAGEPLPKFVAIFAALMVGVAFFAVCAGILGLFGIRVTEPDADSNPKDQ